MIEAKERGVLPRSVENGINPVDIPRDIKGRISWVKLKKDPDRLRSVIESETSRFLATGNVLTQQNLNKLGWGSLGNAIGRYYPRRLSGLRENLGLVFHRKPDGYWSTSRGKSEIQRRVAAFVQREGSMSTALLQEKDRYLLYLVLNRYKGGLRQALFDLGISKSRPRGFWTREKIFDEAKSFIANHGKISHNLMERHGETSLSTAIRSYPGMIHQLRKDLNAETKRKIRGHWTPEQIRQEARSFYERAGVLDRELLHKRGEDALTAAIGRRYPGGLSKLREDLGIKVKNKPPGYWTLRTIEAEAWKIYQKTGKLTMTDENPIKDAIVRKYPGGIDALRKKLGIETPYKPRGYWTNETIEREAQDFLQRFGSLSSQLLDRHASGLGQAITMKYLGGMNALKVKLGLEPYKRERIPSKEEARRELQKLVEVKA